MPEGGTRPRAFANKPCFLLTARVHPGETPASHGAETCDSNLRNPPHALVGALCLRLASPLPTGWAV